MAEYYIQNVPDLPVVIHLNLDAVDRIGQEVMSGFGKVPRRGAEVGGVLLGSVVDGEKPVVRIDDFVPVPIEYRFGPSWLLSETDEAAFAELVTHVKKGPIQAVGLMRSNTRPEQNLASEDLALLDKYFPERPLVMLMVRPFATRPSVAAFFARAHGPFEPGTQAGPEFPFRRKALTAVEEQGASPAMPAVRERSRRRRHEEGVAPVAVIEAPPETAIAAEQHMEKQTPVAPARRRSAWMWVPLALIFLLLGVLLGFQAALSLKNPTAQADPYDLRLSVSQSGKTLTVKWDHASEAVRASQRGTLYIEEGDQERPVELGTTDLTSGSVVYSPASSRVEFRLQVFPKNNASVTQTVDWGQ